MRGIYFDNVLLSFFRINDPYRLLGLLVIIIIITIIHFIFPAEMLANELRYAILGEAIADGKSMFSELIDNAPPLAAWIFGLKNLLMGRTIIGGQIVAAGFIFFQASYFAVLLINNKTYAEGTYLPALIFALLNFVSFDLLSLTPELIACTLLLLALNQLFHEIEFKIQRDDIVLKLGFYLGLSTLLVFTYGVFLLISIFILIVFTRAGGRKIVLMIFGFVLPHALLYLTYYYFDHQAFLWKHYYLSNLTVSGGALMSIRSILVIASIPIAYLVFAIFMMNREARFTKYQSQLMQVMFLWAITALVQLFLVPKLSAASLLPFIPPFAYFISHYLLLIRRRWRAELMLWIFLLSIMGINLSSKLGKIESVDYNPLFLSKKIGVTFQDKKVMQLGSDLEVFRNNQLGGFFLNWDLSEPYLREISNYSNVELIAKSFEQDPPDVIIDQHHLFDAIMKRIPSLQMQYQKDGNLYRRVSN